MPASSVKRAFRLSKKSPERVASVCRKRYRSCTNCTKSLGELLCPKRSTGTFWRVSLLGYVKRGGGLVRLPSKCFRISHPLLRSFEIRGFRSKLRLLLRNSDEGLHPSTPPPLKRWTKLLLLSLFVQLFSFCCFFNKLYARFFCEAGIFYVFIIIINAKAFTGAVAFTEPNCATSHMPSTAKPVIASTRKIFITAHIIPAPEGL